MKLILLLLFAVLYSTFSFSQNTFTAIVKDRETNEPLEGITAFIKDANINAVSNSNGVMEFKNILNGRQLFVYRGVGYKEKTDTLYFPLAAKEIYIVYLELPEEELEEIVVSSTRSSRTIEDAPSRVEAISGEELEEKGNMKPGDIRMMLNESTGIQTQQTSATSYNSSIRIQGLDGKYTQIIRDGFPLYSEFSGGLGLLQIAPLDLSR